MLKYLRIAVTALSLTAYFLLSTLWLRCHQRCEYFFMRNGNWLTIIGSNAGTAYLLRKTTPGQFRPRRTVGWKYNVTAVSPNMSRYQRAAGETLIIVPYWLLIAVVGATAFGPWLQWSRRFSLRTLLIATTLVAVGLGIVVMSG